MCLTILPTLAPFPLVRVRWKGESHEFKCQWRVRSWIQVPMRSWNVAPIKCVCNLPIRKKEKKICCLTRWMVLYVWWWANAGSLISIVKVVALPMVMIEILLRSWHVTYLDIVQKTFTAIKSLDTLVYLSLFLPFIFYFSSVKQKGQFYIILKGFLIMAANE